jgi:hypothetical protein
MKRKTLVAVLILMLFFGTTTAYAYWDQTQFNTPNEVIQLGEGATIEVTKTLGSSNCTRLIPYGALLGTHDVYEVVFEYEVELNKMGLVNILAKNITIDGASEHSALVLIDIYEVTPNTVPNSTYSLALTHHQGAYKGNVCVKVMLAMPTSQAQYDAVAGKPISFVLEFSAEALTA